MALQYSLDLRNDWLQSIITRVGSSGVVQIRSGSQPASTASANTGTLLASLTLGATLGTVSNGVLTFNTITGDPSADATGTAGHWRVFNSGLTTCVIQGNCGTSGADMNLSSLSVSATAPFNITSWTITAPGA